MMDVTEVKTQMKDVKEKMFGGEVTMERKDFATVLVITLLLGIIFGLCKGLKLCAAKKDKKCKCKKEECCKKK